MTLAVGIGRRRWRNLAPAASTRVVTYDAGAFNNATLPLHAKDWRSAMGQTPK
jgi:hypothetical protein